VRRGGAVRKEEGGDVGRESSKCGSGRRWWR
jgi:hypothetical protein